MSLLFTSAFGFFFIFLLLFYKFYLYYKKIFAGFPFMNTWSHILYCHVTGKITKDTPLNHVLFEKLIQTCKQYVEEGLFMTFWTRPTLVIYNPKAMKFFTNEKAAENKAWEYHLLEDVMGDGIDTSNGERWRSHRKLMNPAFNLGLLSNKIHVFNEHAMELVNDMEKLAGKPSVTVIDILKAHYFNSVSEFLLGLKSSGENLSKTMRIANCVDNLTEITIMRVFYPWLVPKSSLRLFPTGRKFYYSLKEADDFINEIIFNMKEIMMSNKIKDDEQFGADFRKSLTYILLNQHLKDPTFTIQDVLDEVKTVLSAGYDTIAHTTMWCLSLLGAHPEIQEELFREIESKTSDYITPEECSNLAYLEAVVKETLRLYSAVPIYLKRLTEDVQYDKYKVDKGVSIVFFPYFLHRNPTVYPDPDQFKPERFLDGELNTTYSFMPFSEGSRSCIGKNFAMLEIKIFLAHILRNYKFITLDKREDVRLCWSIVVAPAQPVRMQIIKRS